MSILLITSDRFADHVMQATLRALAREDTFAAPSPPTERGLMAVELVRAAQRRYWPGL